MKCGLCGKDFEEGKIQESHDVPCYLFIGMSRRLSKQRADNFSRHWLCQKCHNKYEKELNSLLISKAIKFSEEFYG